MAFDDGASKIKIIIYSLAYAFTRKAIHTYGMDVAAFKGKNRVVQQKEMDKTSVCRPKSPNRKSRTEFCPIVLRFCLERTQWMSHLNCCLIWETLIVDIQRIFHYHENRSTMNRPIDLSGCLKPSSQWPSQCCCFLGILLPFRSFARSMLSLRHNTQFMAGLWL